MIRDHLEAFAHLKLQYRPDGQCVERFILDNGREFQASEASSAGERGKPGLCFMNAARLALGDPSLRYVEGYVLVCGGIPIEHAWCVDIAGAVIEPTLADPARVGAYFGVIFNTRYLNRSLLANGYYGLLGWEARETVMKLLSGEELAFGDPEFLQLEETAA